MIYCLNLSQGARAVARAVPQPNPGVHGGHTRESQDLRPPLRRIRVQLCAMHGAREERQGV